jgi:hypothetical protein
VDINITTIVQILTIFGFLLYFGGEKIRSHIIAVLNNRCPRSYNSGEGSAMREEKRPDRNWKEYNEGIEPCIKVRRDSLLRCGGVRGEVVRDYLKDPTGGRRG